MGLPVKIAAIACLMVAFGSRAYAEEPNPRIDINQLYATNTICLSDNKAYSVGAVLDKLRCKYPESFVARPAGDHPSGPPEWEAQ